MSPYHSDDSRDDDSRDDDSHVDESYLGDIDASDVSIDEPDGKVRAATDITPASPALSSASQISATSASTDLSFSESKLNEALQLGRDDEYSNPAKWSIQRERLAKRFDRVGLTRVNLPADITLGFGRRGMPSVPATGRGWKEKAEGGSLPEPASPMPERTHGAGDPRAASAGDAKPMSARSLVDIPNKDTISKDCTAETRGSMVHLLAQLGGTRRR